MAETVKTKVLNIDTSKSQSNIKSLKTQIRELKEQLAGLEKGTEEYDRVAKQLADTNQKQIEINEAMKYSNQDLGQTLSNLTAVSAGVIAAIQGVNVVMQLFGASEKEATNATKSLQETMALIQSLTAIDQARKSFEGLKNAFSSLGKSSKDTEKLSSAEEKLSKSVKKTTAAETNETTQLNINSKAKKANTAATTEMATKTNVAKTAVTTFTTGIKNMAKALLTNPFTLFLGAAAAVITVISNLVEKNKELKEAVEAHKKAEEERAFALNNLPNDFNMVENSVKWANSGMEELTNSSSELYNKIRDIAGEIQRTNPAQKSMAWKLAFDQVYEEATKEGDKEKQRLIELTRLQWEFYRIKRVNYETDADFFKAQDEALAKLYSTYATQTKNTTTNTNQVTKSIKDLTKEIKELYSNLLGIKYEEMALRKIYNGVYDETEALFDNIERIIKTRDLGGMLTENFSQAIADKKNPLIRNYEVTIDNIFGQGVVEEKEKELLALEQKLAQTIRERNSLTDPVVKKMREQVDMLSYQVASMKMLAEAAQKYADHWDKVERDLVEINRVYNENETHNENELKYRRMLRDYNQKTNAETFKAISDATEAYDKLHNRLNAAREEYANLMAQATNSENPLQNKAILDRIDELFAYINANEQAEYEALMALEDANYQARLKHIEDLKTAEEEKVKVAMEERERWENNRLQDGNYNDTYAQLQIEKDLMEARKQQVEEFYNEQLELYKNNANMYALIEMEKNEVILQLDRDLEDKRNQITQEGSRRRLNILKSYVSVYQTLSSQTLNIMSAAMDGMKENSQEYKNMKYAQGVIDTISGTLAGFMSGVESGLPAPYNLILGGVVAAAVAATGAIQLANLKNEELSNSTASASSASSASNGGFGAYDTLAYAQGNDILGSIADTRVYVVESDITTTQNRVEVTESNATF